MFKFTLLFVALLPLFSWSQKKVIDHTIYNDWKKIDNALISANGRYVAYEINPLQGDGFLFLYDQETGKKDSFPRAKEAQFSFLNDFLVFKITPGFDTLRNCELNKIDKKKWPKDTLGIYIFASDSLTKVAKLKSFKLAEKTGLLAYTIDDNKLESVVPAKKKKKHSCKKNTSASSVDKNEVKSDGNILTVIEPKSGSQIKLKNVTDYLFSENGKRLAVVSHQKDKVDSFALTIYEGKDNIIFTFPNRTSIRQLSYSKDGENFAFVHSADTNNVKNFQLEVYNFQTKTSKRIADTLNHQLPAGKAISENYKPLFTEDNRILYFGIADSSYTEPKDTLLETEKPKLDIWHYQDERIQPQQLVELKWDQKKSQLYAYLLKEDKFVPLSNDTLSLNAKTKLVGDYLFAYSDESYKLENQWDSPDKEDHYRISVLTGETELIKKAVRMDGQLSPSGKHYTYFNEKTNNYYYLNPTTKEEKCITCSSKNVNWQRDMNGMPMLAYPFGVSGYTENEEEILLQSEHDIWTYSIANNTLFCLTNAEGLQTKTRLSIEKWYSDSVYYSYENSYVKGFNETTKAESIYTLIDHGDHTDMVQRYSTNHKIAGITRSKGSDKILFRKMSLSDYPELRLSNIDFSTEKIVTNTNPQQADYNWATVELIKWKSYDGIPLEGLLYKPENFDPSKSYPLLIYYYELYSDDIHNHYTPKPTASIIYPTEYASAGYIVFIPDVRYKIGHPAKSAYDCIMSGTDHVLKLVPSVDPKRMGLQGQSWGGYQTAQLITMTDRFAAAMAGAPVSNMFSAYGGIRWGSGVNRQFQYERTQSRIGKTIWEAPELYIENSPLFHLPKVKTPLLIMHNDEDGAVPWYQSIELYTGMRRLQKPVWLLNYNGDDHNLMKNANRFDLSIRMRQFFDHYLMGQEAPVWLKEGIPAVKKGKELGY
jgi:dipeptidyl aminopeptidase/acylaminoacyl peptidase